jgi:putative oxidoreductase
MNLLLKLTAWNAALGRMFDWLQPVALLAARLYVADVFIRSGWLKLNSWDQTVELFTSEYHVPLLSPELAAVAGTAGELFFPVLLALGLFGRVGAIGTFIVNAVAVISYSHVLMAEGFEAALGQHILWGVLTLGVIVFGPGALSVDAWLQRRWALREYSPDRSPGIAAGPGPRA